jgi:hypothetical protein
VSENRVLPPPHGNFNRENDDFGIHMIDS